MELLEVYHIHVFPLFRYFHLQYIHFIVLAIQASDVLAVELLQKDARHAISGELGKPCTGKT